MEAPGEGASPRIYRNAFTDVFLTMRHFFNTAGGLLDKDNSFFL